MRLTEDNQILDESIRKQILDEVDGQENQNRRNEAYKRDQIYRDQTRRFVIDKLLQTFDQTTVREMDHSISNVSLYRKVIDKLSRVYSHGVTRKIIGSDDDTKKLNELEKLLEFNFHMKNTNRFLKAQKNVAFYLKPCPFIDNEGNRKFRVRPTVLNQHLYSVVEDFYDRTRPLVYILNNFEQFDKRSVSLEPSKEGRTIATPQPPILGDNRDQLIADTKEDENQADEEDNRQFLWWSDKWHFTTNRKGAFVDPGTNEPLSITAENQDLIINPIGEKPLVEFAVDQNGSFWSRGGDDLVDGAVLINCLISNLNHIGNIQGYGQLVVTGNKLPRNILTGPDKAILLEHEEGDPTPTFQYVSADPSLDELRGNIEMQTALLLTTNNLSTSGISTSLNSNGSFASGIALMIDKSESQEDVVDQQQIFRDKEPDVWRIINKWLMLYSQEGTLDPDQENLVLSENFEDNFVIDFGQPETIITESERLANIEKRKDLGINTMLELIMRDNPDLTEEQAKEKLADIRKEKQDLMQSAITEAKGDPDASESEENDINQEKFKL